ncbi:MAG: Ca-activated chloride channel family protein [Parvicella sp.]|jgi:Ca-activated chloride channel family protein
MDILQTYQFEDAWLLWFLLLIPALIAYYIFIGKNEPTSFKVSSISVAKETNSGGLLYPTRFALKMLALTAFIIALARPQLNTESDSFIEQYKEGIDIVIALDASGSMNAQDFIPNRFEAAKAVAQNFAEDRVNDRIGLVIFEGEAYTQCPLTSDNKIVKELIGEAKQEIVAGGTAIGTGLATAVNRLKESDAKSKVIILLTDGVNTHGKIHPSSAAEIAAKFGIRVYTIGVGKEGKAKMPVMKDLRGNLIYDYVEVEIDEKLLKEISKVTGGKYFRAENNASLAAVYSEIDQLEKAKIETIEYELDLPEKSMPIILLGILFLALDLLFSLIFKTLS